jgi:hypothetical protein
MWHELLWEFSRNPIKLPRSVLVDKLSKDCSDSLKIGVACVYLDLGNQSKQTTTGIIGVITKQLLGQLPRIPKRIGDIWRQHRLNNASIEQIKEMLCEACEAFTETYICIDALDECKDRSTLLDYFTKAHSTVNSIRLICTGRPHIHQSIINIALLNPHMVTIKACESDLRKFIKWRIEKDNKPAYMNQELKEEIIQTLLGISDGMFVNILWQRMFYLLNLLQISSTMASYQTCAQQKQNKAPPKRIAIFEIECQGDIRPNNGKNQGFRGNC